MRKIQNTNISFRATTDLKQRLTEYCLENDLHNSYVIRQALNSYLRQETKTKVPRLMAERQDLKRAISNRVDAVRAPSWLNSEQHSRFEFGISTLVLIRADIAAVTLLHCSAPLDPSAWTLSQGSLLFGAKDYHLAASPVKADSRSSDLLNHCTQLKAQRTQNLSAWEGFDSARLNGAVGHKQSSNFSRAKS